MDICGQGQESNSDDIQNNSCTDSNDLFKESFKKYRSKKKFGLTDNSGGGLDSCSIIDVEEETTKPNILKKIKISNSLLKEESCCQCGNVFFGLKPISTWEVYEFTFPAGLIFLKNPFTSEGQRYWIAKSLSDYHENPYVTNIDNLCRVSADKTKVSAIKKGDEEFYKKLRWVTFGYHHDWDTKVYSDSYKCEFPPDLGSLTKYIANVLDFKDFKAEAAIVNYYHLDSTLSGHVDRSEANQEAPLFSLSFGQTAIFLIGGRTKDVKPAAVYLRSGDIVVMTGESRFSYHGVPCILSTNNRPWIDVDSSDGNNDDEDFIISKKPKFDFSTSGINCCSKFNQTSYLHRCSPDVNKVLQSWSDFHSNYVSKSRINLNVRQVLFPGQESLEFVESDKDNLDKPKDT